MAAAPEIERRLPAAFRRCARHVDAATMRLLLALLEQARDGLAGARLADVVLDGLDLRGARLERADLRGVSARAAKLSDASLRGACLWQADLSGATLRGADLRGAQLGRARLPDANLAHANLEHAHLWQAELPNAALEFAHASAANFTDASLVRTRARGLDACDARWGGARLDGADMRETRLERCDFRGASLCKALWTAAHARGADATGANMIGLDLQRACIDDMTLDDAQLWPDVAQRDVLRETYGSCEDPLGAAADSLTVLGIALARRSDARWAHARSLAREASAGRNWERARDERRALPARCWWFGSACALGVRRRLTLA